MSSIDSVLRRSLLTRQDEFPECEGDLIQFATEIGQNFKRTHQIKDMLLTTWVKDYPNAKCDITGNSLLHVAAKLDEQKLSF